MTIPFDNSRILEVDNPLGVFWQSLITILTITNVYPDFIKIPNEYELYLQYLLISKTVTNKKSDNP